MNKVFECKIKKSVLFKKPNSKSEHLKEILFGEKFIKIKQCKNFFYGYCEYDNYKGYIKKNNLILSKKKHNYLINSSKAFLYKNRKINSKTKNFLYLNSRVYISKISKTFSRINDKWIKNSDLKPLNKKKNDHFLKKVSLFNNSKYVWGGNTVDGIDCSGLVQELMKNVSKKCPRDSIEQEVYFKKKVKLTHIKKGDLLFWKGHVAIAINNKKCVHAYGPVKKVTQMKINNLISILQKKSLKLSSIRRP